MSDSTDPQHPAALPAISRGRADLVRVGASSEKYRSDALQGEPIRRRSRGRWITLAILGIAAVFAFIRFFHTEKSAVSSDTVAAGWDDLGECSATTSVDGQRRLTLSSDQTAELTAREQASKNNAAQIRSGKWAYDELTRKYLVTLDGQTTRYSIWSLEGVATCILASGSFENANLRESWFSAIDDKLQDGGD
jgi:hypothetical protein